MGAIVDFMTFGDAGRLRLWLWVVLVALPVLVYFGRDKTFMQPAPLQGGLAIRVAVTASWYPTGAIGHPAHIRKRLSRLGWGRTHVVRKRFPLSRRRRTSSRCTRCGRTAATISASVSQ